MLLPKKEIKIGLLQPKCLELFCHELSLIWMQIFGPWHEGSPDALGMRIFAAILMGHQIVLDRLAFCLAIASQMSSKVTQIPYDAFYQVKTSRWKNPFASLRQVTSSRNGKRECSKPGSAAFIAVPRSPSKCLRIVPGVSCVHKKIEYLIGGCSFEPTTTSSGS